MAKFDELLEQTYQTLGETYGGASMAPGKEKADAAKLAAVAAAAEDGDEESQDDLAEIGKDIDPEDVKS